VVKFPNLGIIGGCKESGESNQVEEERETGDQPNKAPKHNLLPGINTSILYMHS
jgi:hypothetical protein